MKLAESLAMNRIVRELGEKHPIVDLNLFRNRNFLVGSAAFCLGWLCVAMMAFV